MGNTTVNQWREENLKNNLISLKYKKIYQILQEKKLDHEERMIQLKNGLMAPEEAESEMGDESMRTIQFADTVIMMNKEDQILNQINLAMQRLEEGVYGRCVECDSEIPYKRLEKMPEALLCIDCQSAQEHTP